MKALLLDGTRAGQESPNDLPETIADELTNAGWDVESLNLRRMRIAYCLGCFQCWTKTPGVCRMNDDGREVARRIVASDLVVLFTPVTFGGYSSEIKKALDRVICVVSPFFMKVGGEIHHKPRYERYPRIMGVGVIPQADEEIGRIFTTLVRRNAINAHTPAHVGGVILSSLGEGEIRKEIQTLFQAVEAR